MHFISQLNVKLRAQAKDVLPSRAGKVTVQGSNANVSHTMNEDERAEFTNHINSVSAISTVESREPYAACSQFWEGGLQLLL